MIQIWAWGGNLTLVFQEYMMWIFTRHLMYKKVPIALKYRSDLYLEPKFHFLTLKLFFVFSNVKAFLDNVCSW